MIGYGDLRSKIELQQKCQCPEKTKHIVVREKNEMGPITFGLYGTK